MIREKADGLAVPAPGRDAQALLDRRPQPLFSHAVTPVGQRRAIEARLVPEHPLATEIHKGFSTQRSHSAASRQVVHVLQNREPRHQPRHEQRSAGPALIDRPETSLENAQSIFPVGTTSGWPSSMIWSSRARNRSRCPVSRRSRGFISKPPNAAVGSSEHAFTPKSKCQKTAPSQPNPPISNL
jgi:hypothetical protein